MQERFSNTKLEINVTTVGQMIAELSRLPRDLRVAQGFSGSADLVVFDASTPDRYLSVEEGNQFDDDADVESQDL